MAASDRKYFVLLLKGAGGADEAVDVMLELAVDFGAGFMKIDSAVLAVFVSAGGEARDIFCERSFHRPHERMNRAKNQDGRIFVPAGITQALCGRRNQAVARRSMRCRCRVRWRCPVCPGRIAIRHCG